MSNFDYSDFLNAFDIFILLIIFFSIFFALKNGLIKSVFNLSKWALIILSIKFSFDLLRPYVDLYIKNSTVADIAIFILIFVSSYIILSSLNRVLIGIIQPNKSGIGDHLLGSIFGLFRGYTIAILVYSFVSSAVPITSWPEFLKSGSLLPVIQYGEDLIGTIPNRIEDASKIIA